jgi:hypothetical protein
VKEIALAAPRPTHAHLCLVLALVTGILSGCGGGRVILPLIIDPTSPTIPSDARQFGSTDAAVLGIAAIMARSFALPFPEQVTVYLYAGRQAFEHGLIQDAHVSPPRAAELSGFAIGIGQRRQLLLKEDAPDRGEPEWLRLIAHELTHVSQIELAGGEERGEQWLAEGMAEWVAFATLEHLRLDTLSRRRIAATARLREHPALIQTPLDLETRGTARGFTVWHMRAGSLPTYQLAFLMADYLIARQGLDNVKAYFRAFTESNDRHRNFRNALGVSLAEFEAGVLDHLRATAGLTAASALPDAPGISHLPSAP